MASILELLASYRKHGHKPLHIGNVTIGRTVYAAGSYTNADETAIVLKPIRRTDWANRNVGPTPALLPASYRRSKRTVFEDTRGKLWYIAAWHPAEQWVILHPVRDGYTGMENYRHVLMLDRWQESFETAMHLAGPAVLARINENN